MESTIKGGLLRHLIVVVVKGKAIFNFPMDSAIKGGLLRHLIVVLVKGKTIRASILPMESTIEEELL